MKRMHLKSVIVGMSTRLEAVDLLANASVGDPYRLPLISVILSAELRRGQLANPPA